MSVSYHEGNRHIFPRWRSFEATSELGELARPAKELENDPIELDLSLARGVAGWEGSPSLWRGLDLLGTAVIAGRLEEFSALVAEVKSNPLAPRAAREFLARRQGAKAVQLELPGCDTVPGQVSRSEIRTHRLNLASAPRDPIEWMELARSYTIAGLNDKAGKAVLAALQLAPNNRFVLRSAARFFIHIGEKDIAHGLLSRSQIIKQDPWIMASEIAISDSLDKTSRISRIAREKMQADVPPSELTELASALGSLEADSGNHRVARRFLRRALDGANENSIAQIRWLNRSRLNRSDSEDAVDVSGANPPRLHEANAWEAFHRGEFDVARNESLCWLKDQPFASAPAILNSYIASSIFLDFEAGKDVALGALRSNPNDPFLLNNLAVCLMELGELASAESYLASLPTDKRSGAEATYRATFGMLEFRKENIEEGRRLYLEAIEKAKDTGDKATAARAAFHLAFEELNAHTSHVDEAIKRLKEFEGQEDLVEKARFFERVNALLREGE
jgi:tetratricopeptide (TPR) repeat protein